MPDCSSTKVRTMDFPLYVDSSMRTTWNSCKRKHLWAVLHQLYPMGKSVHLIAGASLAAGLEAARKRIFHATDPKTVSLEEALIPAHRAFLREWGNYEPPEGSAKSFVNTWAALVYYLETHWPATDELQPWIRPDGSPAVEYKFAIPLEDIPHPDSGEPMFFVGRFDMIGLLPYGGGQDKLIAVVDEKTTSSITYNWATKWDLRGQFLGYIWALRQQGIPCSHAIVRGIAIQKTQTVVKTALIQYPEHLLSRWEQRMKSDVVQMIGAYVAYKSHCEDFELAYSEPAADQLYPYDLGDACESYGGCAFASLCTARDPEPWMTNFIRHRFNPLEKQPVEELPHHEA